MNLSHEAREKIADIIYHLNVEPDEVDKYVDEIADAITDAPQKLVINMGDMKITPEMMDTARDLMIRTLTQRCTDLRDALKPFADAVYNDNGDCTVSIVTDRLAYTKAYFAHKG